jgi:outer membrane protein assembly factor BamB
MPQQENLLIVSAAHGTLQGVDAPTGTIVWEQHPARSLEGAVGASAQGHILLLYLDGYLEARNPLDGAIFWQKQLLLNASLPVGDCHAIASHTAVALVYGRTLAIIQPADGTLLWSYRSSAYSMRLLTVTDEHLYLTETVLAAAPSTQATLPTGDPMERHRARPPTIVTRAFAIMSGFERWNTADISTSEAPSYGGTPLIEDGAAVYVCGSNMQGGGLYALETQTGSVQWKVEQSVRHRFGQVVAWHEVVAWNSLSLVTAFDANTQHLLWQEDLQTSATSATDFEQFTRIVMSNDRLYLGRSRFTASQGRANAFWIEARDPLTGVIHHRFPDTNMALNPEDAQRFVYTRQVFVLPHTGSLYAFDPSTGSRLWHRDYGTELAVLFQVAD